MSSENSIVAFQLSNNQDLSNLNENLTQDFLNLVENLIQGILKSSPQLELDFTSLDSSPDNSSQIIRLEKT